MNSRRQTALACLCFAAVTQTCCTAARRDQPVWQETSLQSQSSQEQNTPEQQTTLQQEDTGERKIPLILHYIYLGGFDAYIAETKRVRATLHTWYRETCLEVHKHWEIMFWTEAMAEELITTHFSWFLPIWRTYDMEVKRADAIRPFILLHYGGLYLDLDNECYVPAERSFKDYDVVIQGTGFEGVNNGMMAARPGHPLFMTMVDTMMERYKGDAKDSWKNNPIYMTGPAVLTNTVQKVFKLPHPVSGWLGRVYHVNGTKVRVYSLGEFYVPCWGVDKICVRRFEQKLALGTADLTYVVGRHWFSGSWNKPWLFNKDGTPKQRTLLESSDKHDSLKSWNDLD